MLNGNDSSAAYLGDLGEKTQAIAKRNGQKTPKNSALKWKNNIFTAEMKNQFGRDLRK
jgi:hypothetical protein